MSFKPEISTRDFDAEDLRAPVEADESEASLDVQKRPEARLTADVIQRGRDQAIVIPSAGCAPSAESAESGPSAGSIPFAGSVPSAGPAAQAVTAERRLREKLSFRRPSLWNGVVVFVVVYLIGFAAVLVALGLVPDLIDLMLGAPAPGTK
jgi:hypothetical protein